MRWRRFMYALVVVEIASVVLAGNHVSSLLEDGSLGTLSDVLGNLDLARILAELFGAG